MTNTKIPLPKRPVPIKVQKTIAAGSFYSFTCPVCKKFTILGNERIVFCCGNQYNLIWPDKE